MMGRLKSDQGQLFYGFRLGDVVPEDHMVRKIDTALDLSWLRSELAPHYSSMGRPSIDPELMIRMLVVGYVFAIRSERLICREVQVNLAYRWFCKLGIEDAVPDHSAFSRARNERFREGDVFRRVFERVVEACISAPVPSRTNAPRARSAGLPDGSTSMCSKLHSAASTKIRRRCAFAARRSSTLSAR
jgi:transposase